MQGAVPRAIWIAPLGAMNFAGYELAKRAMGVPSSGAKVPEKKEKSEKKKERADPVPDKSTASPLLAAAEKAAPAPAPLQSSGAPPAVPPVPTPAPKVPETAAAAAQEPAKAAGECCAPPAASAVEAAAPAGAVPGSAGVSPDEGSDSAAAPAAEPPPDAPSGGQPLARIESLWQRAPWNSSPMGEAVAVASHAVSSESAHSPVIEAGPGYCAACGRSGASPLPAAAGSGGGVAPGQTLGLPQLRSWLLAWPERW